MVPEETRVLDAEATGGVVGRDMEERGAPAPPLPLDLQNLQEAEVATPPRREVNGHRGLRAPGSRLPQRGTRVAPQIFTDARARDVTCMYFYYVHALVTLINNLLIFTYL